MKKKKVVVEAQVCECACVCVFLSQSQSKQSKRPIKRDYEARERDSCSVPPPLDSEVVLEKEG